MQSGRPTAFPPVCSQFLYSNVRSQFLYSDGLCITAMTAMSNMQRLQDVVAGTSSAGTHERAMAPPDLLSTGTDDLVRQQRAMSPSMVHGHGVPSTQVAAAELDASLAGLRDWIHCLPED